ncbi:hypothetical protein ACWEWU_09365 [Staphylococcus xylosus]
MGMNVSGFDELENYLNKVSKNAEKLSENSEVDFQDLFPTQFMQNHTDTDDIYTFIDNSNLGVKNTDDFNKIQNTNEWNDYVIKSSDFSSWNDMHKTALEHYLKDQLF